MSTAGTPDGAGVSPAPSGVSDPSSHAADRLTVEDLLHSEHEQGPRAGKGVRLAGALVPLAFAAVALLQSLRLGVGTPQDPGPGLWPLLTSAGVLACAVVLLLRERTEADYEKYTRGAALNMLGVASLVVYVLLLQAIGFEVSTLLVTAFWLKVLGRESWVLTLAGSVALTAALYALFILLLGAPIPRLLVL